LPPLTPSGILPAAEAFLAFTPHRLTETVQAEEKYNEEDNTDGEYPGIGIDIDVRYLHGGEKHEKRAQKPDDEHDNAQLHLFAPLKFIILFGEELSKIPLFHLVQGAVESGGDFLLVDNEY
jgi:hypothetical protein